MRYAIVENEEYARLSLCSMLRDLRPDWKLLFTAESVEDTVESLQSDESYPDLIFMDIELDDGSCFDIFKEVTFSCPIVFTTAYENFALQAFDVNSIGYLLKPITLEKLTKMLVKIEGLGRSLSSSVVTDTLEKKSNPVVASHGRILISHRDSYTFISSDEVAFFIAEDKCVIVTLKNGNTFLTDFATLSDCMNVLDHNRFFHMSRNIVVNIDCISKVTKYFKGRLNVDIDAGSESRTVTVSSARKTEFLNWLGHSH